MTPIPYLTLIRPKQWVKNVLVFMPAFFAGTLFMPSVFSQVVLAAVAFSLLASAMYICNDVRDRKADARHPRKRFRPVSSGKIPVPHALAFAGCLVVLAFGIASLVAGLWLILIAYLCINVAYTLFLKHVPILDVAVVASMYVLRIIVGSVAAAAAFSPWITLATFFLALFLIAGKRRSEYGREATERRGMLDGYSRETLDGLVLGAGVLAICAYGLWSVLVHPSPYAVYTVLPVTVVIFRALNHFYQHPEEGESPELMVFSDPWTYALTLLWGISILILLYAF